MAITQVVTQFPPAPNSLDTPEDFNSKSDAFVAHQAGTYVPEVNELSTQMNAEVALINDATADGLQEIATQTSRAASSASSASNSARDAEHSNVASATSANFKGEWDKDTLYKVPSSVYWKGLYYNCLGDSLDDQPDLSGSIWIESGLDRLPTLAIGNINNPLLDLPLKNSLDMKQGAGAVTFTRASTAAYIDRYGVMQYATTDGARFEKEGLLVEGSSTNLLIDSTDIVSSWTNFAVDVISDGTHIDGLNNMVKITANGTNNLHYLEQVLANTSGTDTYTASCIVKQGLLPTIQFGMSFTGGTNVSSMSVFTFATETGTYDSKMENLGNGYYRLSVTATDNNSGNDTIRFRILLPTGVSSDYIWMCCPQLEKMPFRTSYIPTTTAAVTRAAETLKVDFRDNFPGWQNGASYAMDTKPLGAVFSSFLLHGNVNNFNGYINYNSSGDYTFSAGGSSPSVSPNYDYTLQLTRVICTQDKVHTKLHINGEPCNNIEDSTSDIVINPSVMHICSAGSGRFYGYVKNFRVWDFALSDEEIRIA